MRKNLKSAALRPEAFAMRRRPDASVATGCHPEARFWPKDRNVTGRQDFAVEILRAQNALRITVGQQV